jgi:homopolymeric O-antigen transport system permease protein
MMDPTDTQFGQLTGAKVGSRVHQGVNVTTETVLDNGAHTREPLRQVPVTMVQVIEPSKGWLAINWAELWQYRELLYFLIWRDVKVRYKQTLLGAAWAVLQPVMTMIVFTIFFGRLAGLSSKTGGVPYPIFSYAALLPWTFFANSVGNSGNSLVGSTNLITKVYFPRLVIPLASVGAGLVDLGISFLVLLGMMLYYSTPLSWQLALVPALLLGTVLVATGVGTLLSALTVTYRDFRYVVPFMMQIWMFVTPVTYPSSLVPAKWRWLLALNPMGGFIEGFRGAFLARPLDWPQMSLSMVFALLLFLAGGAYFRKVERRFADVI